jgi:hypothetical protein
LSSSRGNRNKFNQQRCTNSIHIHYKE